MLEFSLSSGSGVDQSLSLALEESEYGTAEQIEQIS